MPDRHLASALHTAHNEMMASRWLDSPEFGDRFQGTVRVNPAAARIGTAADAATERGTL